MLRHERFARPHHGVRSTTAFDPAAFLSDRIAARARRYLPLLRVHSGEMFSHTTALFLLGAPIIAPEELHVTIPRPHRSVRRSEIRGHTHVGRLPRGSASLPCASPELALIQSAPLLPFRELVIAIDYFLAPRGPRSRRAAVLTREALRVAIEASRSAGTRRLRAALEVAREGAESRGESMLHFELAAMGMDTIELQVDISDANGRWIGRFDAVDRARRKILEFDGEQHRTDRAQYLKDVRRSEAVEKLGFAQRKYHFEDFSPRSLQFTRRSICDFLGVSPQPVAPWLRRYFAEPYQ